MSSTEYRQRHPLAWSLIGGVALAGVALIALSGRLPAVGIGAAADACADCAVVQSISSDPFHHEVTVRYQDGSTGVFSMADPPQWQPGDRVRVVDGIELVAG